VNNIKNIAIAAALLGTSIAASAQDAPAINPNWYVQGAIGIMHPDKDWNGLSNDKAYGLRVGKPLNENFDVQMGYTWAKTDETGRSYKQETLGVDALYFFSRKTFRPFVLVGVGAERDHLSPGIASVQAKRTSPYVSAGLGFQSVINDRWSFQADVRNVHGFLRGDEFRPSKVNNQYLMFALSYALGPTPQPPAPPAPPVVAPEPAPAPVPVAPPPPPPARFEKVTMSATELFAFDSAKLAPEQPKLDDMAKLLNDNPSISGIIITGYTDRIGSDKYNQKLSEQRANSVKAYLVGKGVGADRLTAQGKGKANPVVACDGKKQKRADLIKCLEPNRRVEVEQITVERKVQ
jgi:OOP family OmpA-OmpF porin